MRSRPTRLSRLSPWQPPPPGRPLAWSPAPDTGRAPVTPASVIVVAATPRSGSSLLSDALRASGRLGDPQEYFNLVDVASHRGVWGMPSVTTRGAAGVVWRRARGAPQWSQSTRYTRRSMQRFRDRVMAASTSSAGIFSVKVHWPEYAAFRGSPWDPRVWQVPVTWIHVTRGDRLRQAVSFVRATQTDSWNAWMPARAEPHYDANAIESAARLIDTWEAGWQGLFAPLGLTPVEVTYEQLDADYDAQVRRVLDHLGQPDLPVPRAVLARQADETTDDWVARFLAERGPWDTVR